MSEDAGLTAPAPEGGDSQGGAHHVWVRFHESGNGLKCIFRGRMDASVAAGIEPEVRERLAGAAGKRIAYELSAVDYIASSFIRFCIMASKASGGDFAILNPTHEVRKVLRLAGLESLVRKDV